MEGKKQEVEWRGQRSKWKEVRDMDNVRERGERSYRDQAGAAALKTHRHACRCAKALLL